MLCWKAAAVEARRWAAGPLRRGQLRRLSAAGCAPLCVLFYHRVADRHPNDWTISHTGFQQHIDYLRQRFELISLTEVQRRVRDCSSDRLAVALTFDDGYAENCDFALPLLVRHQIPCTYFVSVQHVLSGMPFDHDARAGQPLPVNTVEQLRAAADAGIEIGLHTRTHVDFAEVTDPLTIEQEIVEATAELTALIGRPIRHFAFPYGLPQQLTQPAIEAVRRAGLDGFCSAYGAYNLPGRDAFHIRRIHGDPQFYRLRNWLEFDARKLRIEPQVLACP